MEENEKQLRVAIYLRVSTEEQAEKYGLEAQRKSIEGSVLSRGVLKDGRPAMILAGENYVYVDDGISGTTKIAERPAFARLIEDITNSNLDSKPFDVVAVYRIDRFARKLTILLNVLELFRTHKLEFISATESVDTSTPFGRAMLGILGVVAELELETIKERTSKGKAIAFEQGKYMGSHPTYGYTKDEEGRIKVLEEEAVIVKRIFKMYVVDRLKPPMIATKLREDNVLSPSYSAVKCQKKKGTDARKKNPPCFWLDGEIKDILIDEIYTGIYYYPKSKKNKPIPREEWKASKHLHEAIIPQHLFDLTQEYLRQEADRRGLIASKSDDDHCYLLSSLLKCDHCKSDKYKTNELSTWTGTKKEVDKGAGNFSYYYQCNRKNSAKNDIVCQSIPIPAEPIENYVVDFVKRLLKDPKRTYEYSKGLRSKRLEKFYLKDLEIKKQNYVNLYNGLDVRRQNLKDQHVKLAIISTETLASELEKLKEKETEYKSKIAEIDYTISQQFLSSDYEDSLSEFAKLYKDVLESNIEDRIGLYNLIHDLVYQIIVYSRPKTDSDIIAGRRKEGQVIPERIDIYLNLPETILGDYIDEKFSVRNPML